MPTFVGETNKNVSMLGVSMDGIGRRFSRLECLLYFKGTLTECNYLPVVILPMFLSE